MAEDRLEGARPPVMAEAGAWSVAAFALVLAESRAVARTDPSAEPEADSWAGRLCDLEGARPTVSAEAGAWSVAAALALASASTLVLAAAAALALASVAAFGSAFSVSASENVSKPWTSHLTFSEFVTGAVAGAVTIL